MKGFLFILSVTGFIVSCNNHSNSSSSLEAILAKGKWVDLSYDFSDKTLYWPNNVKGFTLDTFFRGKTTGGFYYSAYTFSAPEHGGTHLDAPVHFAEGKLSTDQLSIDQLTGGAIVIDVSEKVSNNPDYLVQVTDVEDWEKKNGKIAEASIVLFRTGYGIFYPDAKKYFGTEEKGSEAVAKLHFPGIDPATAEWLCSQRKIKAVGIDTPSIDNGQSKDFKTHQALMGKNIPAFENVANLDKLPATGVFVIALPMKIKGGSGGPLRIVAWVGR